MSVKQKAPALSKIDESASTVTAARIRLDLTQAAFARLLETPLGTVRGWEQGRRKPPPCAMLLMRIAVARPEVFLAGPHTGPELAPELEPKAENPLEPESGKKVAKAVRATAALHEPGDDSDFWLL